MKRLVVNEEHIQIILNEFRMQYRGKKSAVKTELLLNRLRNEGKVNLSPQTFRQLMGHIRNSDLLAPSFIVSDVHRGYWLSDIKQEQEEFLGQEMTRMSNQFENLKNLHIRLTKGSRKKVEEQPTLF